MVETIEQFLYDDEDGSEGFRSMYTHNDENFLVTIAEEYVINVAMVVMVKMLCTCIYF